MARVQHPISFCIDSEAFVFFSETGMRRWHNIKALNHTYRQGSRLRNKKLQLGS